MCINPFLSYKIETYSNTLAVARTCPTDDLILLMYKDTSSAFMRLRSSGLVRILLSWMEQQRKFQNGIYINCIVSLDWDTILLPFAGLCQNRSK